MQQGPAIGLIETNGMIAMVVAADAALKGADVTLLGYQVVRTGLVTVMITGTVDAVSIAVEIGVRQARVVGRVYNSTVLTRAEDETRQMLEMRNTFKQVRTEAKPAKELPIRLDVQATNGEGKATVPSDAEWEGYSVVQLRRMVRKIPQTELVGRQISRANRNTLIEVILRYQKEVGDK